MRSNAEIIREGYTAFARQDMDAVRTLLDDDIEWYSPDELPAGGTFRGPEAVIGFLASLPHHYTELRTEPEQFHEAGDRVLVQGHHRGQVGSGQEFEVGFAHVYTMRDGKAVQFREYVDSGKMMVLVAQVSSD